MYSRIISLVPSITETLFHLDLSQHIVGITEYCIEPQPLVNTVAKIGGVKNPDFKKIMELNPDIIVCNIEENGYNNIKKLGSIAPLSLSDVKSIDDTTDYINKLGLIFNREEKAVNINNNIKNSLSRIVRYNTDILYLIWKAPFMSINRDTYISDVLHKFGLNNVCSHYKERYMKLSDKELLSLSPQLIILPDEPFEFTLSDRLELENMFDENVKVIMVDGKNTTWYGWRTSYGIDYLVSLFEKLFPKTHLP